MSHLEREDRDLDLNVESDFYEDDSMYDEFYEGESFGERVDSGREEDDVTEVISDDKVEVAPATDAPTTQVEEGFGEAINPISNPHIDDQLADPDLGEAASADYEEGS